MSGPNQAPDAQAPDTQATDAQATDTQAPGLRAKGRRGAMALAGLGALAGAAVAWGTAGASSTGLPARALGWGALVCLALSLAASPLRAGLPAGPKARWGASVVAGRRLLGLASLALAGAHTALTLGAGLGAHLIALLEVAWLRHGALTLALLAALGLTSFPALSRALRVRAWKTLHRAVYAAAALASLHALGAPGGSVRATLGALAAFTVLLAARPLGALRSSFRHDR